VKHLEEPVRLVRVLMNRLGDFPIMATGGSTR
jgi:hypothetical protein